MFISCTSVAVKGKTVNQAGKYPQLGIASQYQSIGKDQIKEHKNKLLKNCRLNTSYASFHRVKYFINSQIICHLAEKGKANTRSFRMHLMIISCTNVPRITKVSEKISYG